MARAVPSPPSPGSPPVCSRSRARPERQGDADPPAARGAGTDRPARGDADVPGRPHRARQGNPRGAGGRRTASTRRWSCSRSTSSIASSGARTFCVAHGGRHRRLRSLSRVEHCLRRGAGARSGLADGNAAVLPQPDLTIALDIPPATALARKQTGRDRYESDLELLARVRESYRRQAAQSPSWALIDGETVARSGVGGGFAASCPHGSGCCQRPHLSRSGRFQHPRAGVQRRPGRGDIIHQQHTSSCQQRFRAGSLAQVTPPARSTWSRAGQTSARDARRQARGDGSISRGAGGGGGGGAQAFA